MTISKIHEGIISDNILIILFGIILSLPGCEKKLEKPPMKENVDDVVEEIEYNMTTPYALNVIYFIPNDKEPLPRYHERLSGILLLMQDFYRTSIKANGFGDRSFGLELSDNSLVNIQIINAKEDHTFYPYEGGGSRASSEILEYFEENPEEKTSEHFLVFMPSTMGQHGYDAGGVPFYGLGGRFAFVMDYANFEAGMDPAEAGAWLGGTFHEAGHGFWLPHNQHKGTDNWTSLMSWGNMTYTEAEPEKTRLTKASCSILDVCQVFAIDNSVDYYSSIPAFEIKKLNAYYHDDNIIIDCRFSTDITVKSAITFHDPYVGEGDANYNAVSYCTTDIIKAANGVDDSIHFVMPVSGLITGVNSNYTDYPFSLMLWFNHENGQFSTLSGIDYEWEGSIPTIFEDIGFDDEEISRSGWTVYDYSSQGIYEVSEGNMNGAVEDAIDGNINTYWVSEWEHSQPDYPHYLAFDMGKSESVNGFFFTPVNRYDGRPDEIIIEVKIKGDDEWTSLGSFHLEDNSMKQKIQLGSVPQNFRYFKVSFINSHTEFFYTHMAEISVY